MIAAAELAAQRFLTKWFIDADHVPVILKRSEWVSDGAGGSVRSNPVDLPPQRMRIIPLGEGGSTPERFNSNGEAVRPTYKLLGLFDCDMERYDEFELEGVRYEIVFVNQNRQYEVKGEAAYRGGI